MKSTPFDRIASDCMARKTSFPEDLAKQYVRILQKLNDSWGLPGAVVYLDELIMPSRTDRQGFPPNVVQELVSLKQLHEFLYQARNPHIWDPYYHFNQERFKEFQGKAGDGEIPAGGEIPARKSPVARQRPSVYKSWFSSSGSRNFRKSPIGGLYPSKGSSGRKTNPGQDAASNAIVAEILEDAEEMLDIRRMQSAIALYEQAILRFPRYSAYPHLRLLELHYDMDNRPDFERVARQFSEHFSVGPIRWVLVKVEFWSQLDRIAAALLAKTVT
jgi:hypothetical protein